jgi:N-acetylated-alpha-linked acidic dipeptidase
LENFANEVAKDIEDPETKLSAWQRLRLAKIQMAAPDKKAEVRARPDLRIEALGSGSDYTVFLDHLGVPSINLGFFGEQSTGEQYHSIYDDFYWYTHYSDTDFSYGRALAQTAGTMLLRLADANVIPLQFTNFADTIQVYDRELKKLAEDKRAEIEERNKEIDEGLFTAVDDPKHKLALPARQELPPHLNFAPLDNAVDALVLSASAYEKALAAAGGHASLAINANLIRSERLLTDPAGLPNREWFRNMIYAPGFYTGYGVKTLPAIREAIDQKQWILADEQIIRVAKVLDGETALLNSTARQLAQ